MYEIHLSFSTHSISDFGMIRVHYCNHELDRNIGSEHEYNTRTATAQSSDRMWKVQCQRSEGETENNYTDTYPK